MTITWTKCSEALPDDDITVLLAFDDGDVGMGYHTDNRWRELDFVPIEDGDVTHWAHLPAHPDEEDA